MICSTNNRRLYQPEPAYKRRRPPRLHLSNSSNVFSCTPLPFSAEVSTPSPLQRSITVRMALLCSALYINTWKSIYTKRVTIIGRRRDYRRQGRIRLWGIQCRPPRKQGLVFGGSRRLWGWRRCRLSDYFAGKMPELEAPQRELVQDIAGALSLKKKRRITQKTAFKKLAITAMTVLLFIYLKKPTSGARIRLTSSVFFAMRMRAASLG